MAKRKEELFPRDIASLGEVFDFVSGFCSQACIQESAIPNVNLVVEELFTNAVKYSPNGAKIKLGLEREKDQIVICMIDQDVDRFDITEAPEVDTDAPADERRVGGLGIHLIRKLAREVSYEYKNRNSKIIVKVALED